MGGNSRYKTPMFDHEYRVVAESPDGGKDTVLFESDKFSEADGIFEIAVANNPSGAILLMHRAWVMKRNGRKV